MNMKDINDLKIKSDLKRFTTGFGKMDVVNAATIDNGIFSMSEMDKATALSTYEAFTGKALKFVPASGAATRMFKDLFNTLEDLKSSKEPKTGTPGMSFIANISKFPFYNPSKLQGMDINSILRWVLFSENDGLDYSNKPKGQILFHSYHNMVNNDEFRTAFEEHLVEGARYLKGKGGRNGLERTENLVNIHFTVSPEHMDSFNVLFESVRDKYEQMFDCVYAVSFSVQSPDTDIIAVNMDNSPFVCEDGSYLFRPGGHGALIENLNDLDADIIFIKNIDNIIHEDRINETILWKKILAGYLLSLRKQCFDFISRIDNFNNDSSLCADIISFLKTNFSIDIPSVPNDILLAFLRAKLDRPIRVCGMVKNEGEPGGGPFIVRDADGSTSLQILESAQIGKSDSTHFNPVDIVCSIKNKDGIKYDLKKYVDKEAGLISNKSYKGHDIKAQELPGLWNGAMSNWNTSFVEVPIITFNPVKTVLDLLRPEHNQEF